MGGDMTLLDELCELADRHKNDSEEKRMVLKMAICLVDQLENPNGTRPPKVLFTSDELWHIPGRWELMDGQLV